MKHFNVFKFINGGAKVSNCAGVFDRKSGGYFVPDCRIIVHPCMSVS